jgi:uncharacterized protein YyaL (SSP411 family)
VIRVICRALALSLALCAPSAGAEEIAWRGWSETLFADAQREGRLVLLDLEAVWCHWCHVMDKTTYKDPAVVELIGKGYIAVKVDQDSRPDLSNRYEDYGWPATIIFSSKGEELAKLSGYIPPARMASFLEAFLEDPRPGPSVVAQEPMDLASQATLSRELVEELQQIHLDHYDPEYGSWGRIHKFLHGDSVEYSMARAAAGDETALRMARQTLDMNLKLMDPVWGGVYQYSHGGTWENPHFEKIMSHQTANLRTYALAYARYKDPRYLETARDIKRYLFTFLRSPEGAFYTSQDADVTPGEHSAEYFALSDEERRKIGIPRVDEHVYARENGWVIEALATLADVSGETEALEGAIRAAEWILKERSLPGGGFRHDREDEGGPYLGDTLAMGRAFLSLYASTANREWLQRAEAAADFMVENFEPMVREGVAAGFVTAKAPPASAPGFRPEPQRDENILALRFFNLLYHYSGKAAYRRAAEQAMRYLATPRIARRRPTAGVLLSALELDNDPAHITIVGSKSDPLARRLFDAARKYAPGFRRIEWLDRAEGPLPNPDIDYPALEDAAAFACAHHRCSRPIVDPERIIEVVEKFRKQALPN